MKTNTDPTYSLFDSVRDTLLSEATTRLKYQNFYNVKFDEYVSNLKQGRARSWGHALTRHIVNQRRFDEDNRMHLQLSATPNVDTLALTKIEHAYRKRCEEIEIYKAFYQKQEQRFIDGLQLPPELSPEETEEYIKARRREFYRELDPHYRLSSLNSNSHLP